MTSTLAWHSQCRVRLLLERASSSRKRSGRKAYACILVNLGVYQGLNDASSRSTHPQASDNYAYLRNPIWWAGISTCKWQFG